jgi:hypothetical protein
MKKIKLSLTPNAFMKQFVKSDLPFCMENKNNYPSFLMILPPIYFSLDDLFYLMFNLYEEEKSSDKKIIGLTSQLILILGFFILRKRPMSLLAQNLIFFFIKTCHMIIFMECESWRDESQFRFFINTMKIPYLEIIYLSFYRSSRCFSFFSLLTSFLFIVLRIQSDFYSEYLSFLLLMAAIFIALIIFENEKKKNFLIKEKKKIPKKSDQSPMLKNILSKFPENLLDELSEEIDESIAFLDEKLGIIYENKKFTNLFTLNFENPLKTFFNTSIISIKEGPEELKQWANRRISYEDLNNKNENWSRGFSQSFLLTLLHLVTRAYPINIQEISSFLKCSSFSPEVSPNLRQIDQIKTSIEYKRVTCNSNFF